MQAVDGLLVRVKPTGAQLGARQLAILAQAAAREGNGKVQLTSRANLQVRGLTAASADRFARVVVDLGLASSSPAEPLRNVMSAPLAGNDPAAVDARPFAVALELLLSEPAFAALPPKFGFGVDGGGIAVLPRSADVLVTLTPDAAFIALPGDALAHRTAAVPAAVAQAARSLVALFLEQGGRRMRHLVERLGAERLFGLVGLRAEPFAPPEPRALPVGYTAYGNGFGCFAAALPLGLVEAPALLRLAEAAERHGLGQIATTPWRAFALPAVADPAPVAEALAAAGYIVDPADERLTAGGEGAPREGVAELLR